MAAVRDQVLGVAGHRGPFGIKEIFMRIDGWLLDILACPECHAPLRVDEDASELVCTSATCGLAYPVRDDIPVLLVEEARRPA
jgi:hypothetical protein